MILITHDFDGEWTVWNSDTSNYIEIFRLSETNQHGRPKTVYNIRKDGEILFDRIRHFQSARSLAIKQIK